MTLSFPNRTVALLLGIWVAVMPAIFTIPAAAMTLQMNISDDVGTKGCDNCPDNDSNRGICALMCLNAAHFATISGPIRLIAYFDHAHQPDHYRVMLGQLSKPDPAPPKAVSLL